MDRRESVHVDRMGSRAVQRRRRGSASRANSSILVFDFNPTAKRSWTTYGTIFNDDARFL